MANTLFNRHNERTAAHRLRFFPPPVLRLAPSRGLSLTEVLISLGVLTIGLLGVAAIFPVGSANVQRAEVTLQADAVAQAALNDAITRGLLDPERWVAYEDTEPGADGRGWPTTGATPYLPLGRRGTFSRPYAADYRRRLEFAAQTFANPVERSARLNAVLGSVVVVDPTAVAAHTAIVNGADFDAPQQLASFPSSAPLGDSPLTAGVQFAINPPSAFNGGRWLSWTSLNLGRIGLVTPLQRVSVTSGNSIPQAAATPITFAEADRIATAGDDLALEFPEEEDQPAQTRFLNSGPVPLLRQARQEFSYFLTVSPTTLDAHRALANGGDGAYDVSAVVVNRRALGARGEAAAFSAENSAEATQAAARLQTLQEGERLVRASIQTPGPGASGGEVLFFRGGFPGGPAALVQTLRAGADRWWQDPIATVSEPWRDLRTGQWVFLFGPHPNSTELRPQMFAQWYRVLAIDDSEAENTGFSQSRLRVQLRGPDWPWTNTNNLDLGNFEPTATEGHLFAVIVPDVVAVHTRTLNLSATR